MQSVRRLGKGLLHARSARGCDPRYVGVCKASNLIAKRSKTTVLESIHMSTTCLVNVCMLDEEMLDIQFSFSND